MSFKKPVTSKVGTLFADVSIFHLYSDKKELKLKTGFTENVNFYLGLTWTLS